MEKRTALGIFTIVTALSVTASQAWADCSAQVSVPRSGDTGDVACRDEFGSIVGIARLYNGSSHQIRARLVNGDQFSANGIDSRGLDNTDCGVFVDRDEPQAVNGSLVCAGMVALRMRGF